MPPPLTPLPPRKGASSRAAVSPALLAELNAGRDETRTLSEWLVIDQRLLIRAALRDLGEGALAEAAGSVADSLADQGITFRLKRLGASLGDLCRAAPHGQRVLAALADHRSDMVRALANYALLTDPAPTLAERVARTRPFAADPNMAVRETAWDALRPHLAADLPAAIALLTPWVHDPDARIRRCAVEATRPRGVWTTHLEAIKREPALGLPLLEPLKAEAELYPARAVANWLNDAGKSQPAWLRDLAAHWATVSPVPATTRLLHHATRTLRRRDEG